MNNSSYDENKSATNMNSSFEGHHQNRNLSQSQILRSKERDMLQEYKRVTQNSFRMIQKDELEIKNLQNKLKEIRREMEDLERRRDFDKTNFELEINKCIDELRESKKELAEKEITFENQLRWKDEFIAELDNKLDSMRIEWTKKDIIFKDQLRLKDEMMADLKTKLDSKRAMESEISKFIDEFENQLHKKDEIIETDSVSMNESKKEANLDGSESELEKMRINFENQIRFKDGLIADLKTNSDLIRSNELMELQSRLEECQNELMELRSRLEECQNELKMTKTGMQSKEEKDELINTIFDSIEAKDSEIRKKLEESESGWKEKEIVFENRLRLKDIIISDLKSKLEASGDRSIDESDYFSDPIYLRRRIELKDLRMEKLVEIIQDELRNEPEKIHRILCDSHSFPGSLDESLHEQAIEKYNRLRNKSKEIFQEICKQLLNLDLAASIFLKYIDHISETFDECLENIRRNIPEHSSFDSSLDESSKKEIISERALQFSRSFEEQVHNWDSMFRKMVTFDEEIKIDQFNAEFLEELFEESEEGMKLVPPELRSRLREYCDELLYSLLLFEFLNVPVFLTFPQKVETEFDAEIHEKLEDEPTNELNSSSNNLVRVIFPALGDREGKISSKMVVI